MAIGPRIAAFILMANFAAFLYVSGINFMSDVRIGSLGDGLLNLFCLICCFGSYLFLVLLLSEGILPLFAGIGAAIGCLFGVAIALYVYFYSTFFSSITDFLRVISAVVGFWALAIVCTAIGIVIGRRMDMSLHTRRPLSLR